MGVVPGVTIVSPASQRENNGNWQTARRWAHFLRSDCAVEVVREWHEGMPVPDVLIALHARRSAPSVAAFAGTGRPCVVVLTGTDLYRDIATDADAQRSLQLAARLVLLQADGMRLLDPALRAKASVIYQSAPALSPWQPSVRRAFYDICMVGHLRAEKDPLTFIRAAALVTEPKARFIHIGGALDPALGEAAQQASGARYRWLGGMTHGDTRQRIKRSHALALTSVMEGGANVIIEAVTCAVPVLASDIDGNRGMLGADYAGYFPVGDAQALARLVDRSIADPDWYALLRRQCAARAPLFSPQAEAEAVRALVAALAGTGRQAA